MKAGWRNRKIKRLRKCINGTRGVISLFLAILMLPFLSIAGILIQTARFNSAIAIFDEAQRSWNHAKLADWLARGGSYGNKRKVPDFPMSEAEFLIWSLNLRKDWAVIVCLVGGRAGNPQRGGWYCGMD